MTFSDSAGKTSMSSGAVHCSTYNCCAHSDFLFEASFFGSFGCIFSLKCVLCANIERSRVGSGEEISKIKREYVALAVNTV